MTRTFRCHGPLTCDILSGPIAPPCQDPSFRLDFCRQSRGASSSLLDFVDLCCQQLHDNLTTAPRTPRCLSRPSPLTRVLLLLLPPAAVPPVTTRRASSEETTNVPSSPPRCRSEFAAPLSTPSATEKQPRFTCRRCELKRLSRRPS